MLTKPPARPASELEIVVMSALWLLVYEVATFVMSVEFPTHTWIETAIALWKSMPAIGGVGESSLKKAPRQERRQEASHLSLKSMRGRCGSGNMSCLLR